MNARVPAEPFLPHFKRHIATMDMGAIVITKSTPGDIFALDGDEHTLASRTYSAIEAFAFQADVSYDLLVSILSGRAQTIDFDVADRLLCAAGKFFLWWQEPELRELYYGACIEGPGTGPHLPDGHARCAAPRCVHVFKVKRKGANIKGQHLYCSLACQERAKNVRLRGQQVASRDVTCRHGHLRTPENTEYIKGKRRCKVCSREATKACRERQRERLAAAA